MPVAAATLQRLAALAAAESPAALEGAGKAALWLRVTLGPRRSKEEDAQDAAPETLQGSVAANADGTFTLASHDSDGVPTGQVLVVPDPERECTDAGLVPAVEPPPPPSPPPADSSPAVPRETAGECTGTRGDPLAGIDVGVVAAVQQQLLQLILDLNPSVRLSATLRAVGAARDGDAAAGGGGVSARALAAAGNAIGTTYYTFNGRKIPIPAPVIGSSSGTASGASPARGGHTSGLANASRQQRNATEPPPLLPTVPPPVDADLRQRLCNFYEVHNEYKLPTVAATLRQYEGHEDALFRTLALQYGPEPTAAELKRRGLLEPLPPGWERVVSTRGDVYFRHHDGRRQWKRPRSKAHTDSQDAGFSRPSALALL